MPPWMHVGLAAVCLLALAIGWFSWRGETGRLSDANGTAQALSATCVKPGEGPPTPLFASYRSLHLYLPVDPARLTEIAFHQASFSNALHLVAMLPDADMTAAEANHGTGRTPTPVADDGAPAILDGQVLRMWRSNRNGPPDTAADVGAAPGTQVVSPVSGTVTRVKAYRLYNKYDDFELHIRPVGWDELDVVLVHIDDVCVSEGEDVVGGVSPLGSVRALSDKTQLQLSAYTTNGGDHVHVQLNAAGGPESPGGS